MLHHRCVFRVLGYHRQVAEEALAGKYSEVDLLGWTSTFGCFAQRIDCSKATQTQASLPKEGHIQSGARRLKLHLLLNWIVGIQERSNHLALFYSSLWCPDASETDEDGRKGPKSHSQTV